MKEKLKNLCHGYGWNYAILWCFDQRNPMLLEMEEVYYEDQMEALANNIHPQSHLLGEGIVGEAALSGKHKWIFAEDFNHIQNSSFSDTLHGIFQDAVEIHRQFSCGIKTIAVVPVESPGVLQFGSSGKVEEGAEFLDQARRLFKEAKAARDPPLSSTSRSSKFDNYDLNEWFASFCNANLSPIHDANFNELMETSDLHPLQSLEAETSSCLDQFPAKNTITTSNGDSILSSLDFREESFFSPRLAGECGDNDTNPDEERRKRLKATSPCVDAFGNIEHDDLSLDLLNSYLMDTTFDDFTWPEKSDAGTETVVDHHLSQTIGAVTSVSCVTDSMLTAPSATFSHDPLMELWRAEHQEDGTIAAVCHGGQRYTDSPSSCSWNEFSFEDGILGPASAINVTASSVICSDPVHLVTMNDAPAGQRLLGQIGPGLIDDGYSINTEDMARGKSRKIEQDTRPTRKRARPGESTRPKPKDRQQIQDRLKELRGIIPDGEKGSIDSLLDRTIEHMIFLQSVANFAEKLKLAGEPMLMSAKKRIVIPKGSSQGYSGTIWKDELGNQTLVYPIIIEDLNSPGLMLIETLCESGGFFLEIADVIRGFGLDILKGIMESHEDKLWSRFIVEGSTNMSREDIFWPLVQILQQSGMGTEVPHVPTSVAMVEG